MGFFDTNADSFKTADDIPFKDGEVIGFQCLDFHENGTKATLNLRCRVMTGDHKGKDYKIFLSQDDNDANKKRLQQFFHAFWSNEEILNGTCKPVKLLGRKFVAKCSAREGKPKDGKPARMFRNWSDFQDRGAGDPANAQAQTQSQQTQAQPQAAASPATAAGGELSF